ncbi:hypothetical protein CKAN_01084800 [Cinnamomum micranthum f. kanehirae]|uniref:Uncharacterized protein n=1 Tax=Cinnamomum micranthum f. kanehirae TaxID=337451 RepID=A0A3S3MYT3_9MAGN|nr:hypothetical protein CKAN_01084800 [Cinnamomum micranthum f. kanehirae]
MASSNEVGLMAVVAAVSGSVVLVAMQAHKRLVSEFLKKFEFELGVGKDHPKKKVRFSEEVLEPSANNKEYRRRPCKIAANINPIPTNINFTGVDFSRENGYDMPLNRLALYKGIIEYRMLKGRVLYY